MTDDLKDYEAPTFWRVHRDKVWGAIFIACLLVASFIPNNAERQAGAKYEAVAITNSHLTPVVSAPYTPCPKTNKGKWLKAEIAHWRKDGWVIHCDYRGLMTRDEVRL